MNKEREPKISFMEALKSRPLNWQEVGFLVSGPVIGWMAGGLLYILRSIDVGIGRSNATSEEIILQSVALGSICALANSSLWGVVLAQQRGWRQKKPPMS